MIESSALLIAVRTVIHRWLTEQKPVRSQTPAWLGSSLAQIIGGVIVTAGVVTTNLADTARSRARTQT